jgi:hypothetical protein
MAGQHSPGRRDGPVAGAAIGPRRTEGWRCACTDVEGTRRSVVECVLTFSGGRMLIEIQVSDQSVTSALITGGTTVAVACIKAAAEVAIAWIQRLRPRPPPPREIEPPPDP